MTGTSNKYDDYVYGGFVYRGIRAGDRLLLGTGRTVRSTSDTCTLLVPVHFPRKEMVKGKKTLTLEEKVTLLRSLLPDMISKRSARIPVRARRVRPVDDASRAKAQELKSEVRPIRRTRDIQAT